MRISCEAEKERVFATSWQIVCHLNDIPESRRLPHPGFSRRALGGGARPGPRREGLLQRLPPSRRAAARRRFRPLSRAESSVPTTRGPMISAAALTAVTHRKEFADFTLDQYGLKPVETEIYKGFIFVRLKAGLPSVAEMLAPYEAELAPIGSRNCKPLGRVTLRTRHVNWKNVTDNYSDAMHITVAHPGLTRLFGQSYGVEAQPWVDKMWGYLRDVPSSQLSERMYQAVLPAFAAPAGGTAAAVDLLQAVAERGVRHLSGPDRFHADDSDLAHGNPDPRDRLRAPRRAARNARRALPELAHQPPGQPRGQGAHRAGSDRHGLAQLHSRVRSDAPKSACAALRAGCAISFPRAASKTRPAPGWHVRNGLSRNRG